MIGRMPARVPDLRGPGVGVVLSRRAALRLAASGACGLATVVLAGCDIRLQDDAPDLPLLKRKSIPDEAALVSAVQLVTALGQQAGRTPDASAPVARLAGNHLTQTTVLRARLTSAGVPNHIIDAAATSRTTSPSGGGSTSGTPAPAVSAPPAATQEQLAAAESAATAAILGDLGTVTTANRAVLVAVAAACGAAAAELGAPVSWGASAPLPTTAAAQLLAETRSAGWAFQVVAAQTAGDTRTAASTTRIALAARADELTTMAAAAATPPPLAYVLPFPVTTPEAAGRLAADVLRRLVAAGLGPLIQVPQGSSALSTLVRFQVASVSLARSWGVAPEPFPGMAYP